MLDDKMKDLFTNIFELQMQKIQLMDVEIKDIIANKATDIKRIEMALDNLLDLLEYEDALQLFRKLCKYYYVINPKSTVHYINFYKEQYDPEGIKFGRR